MPGNCERQSTFRANRIFSKNKGWWYSSREGDRGPFPSKDLALLDLSEYKKFKQTLNKSE